jgi:hypothetical protein
MPESVRECVVGELTQRVNGLDSSGTVGSLAGSFGVANA